MFYGRDKISLRQALYLFVNFIGSPSIRFIPSYTSEQAKQAAWLCPFVSLCAFLLYLSVFQSLVKKYKDVSLVEAIQDILGRVCGKTVCIIIFIWITVSVAFNLRYFGERMVTSIFPNTDIIFFLLTMSALVAFVLRSGLAIMARMNEIFFPIVVLIYLMVDVLLIFELRTDNLWPITYKDIIPIARGSIGVTAVWAYFIYLFMFGDLINHKDKLLKEGSQAALFLTFLTILVILFPIGLFGWSVASKMPIPYYAAVKEVSPFGLFAGIESGILTIWILTDFVLLYSLSFAALYTLKVLFGSHDVNPFINIYMVIVFFTSLLICKRLFELQAFSRYWAVPMNILIGYGVPLTVFAVGKVRKKL